MAEDKVQKVMHEFKHGKLHSGSKKGPKVKKRKQAIAIAMSEKRRAGQTTLSPNLVGHEGMFKMVNSHAPDGKEMGNWKSGAVRRDVDR
jgi:hypothetical protein